MINKLSLLIFIVQICTVKLDVTYKIYLRSSPKPVPVVPHRYFPDCEIPTINLKDIGVFQTEINVGDPSHTIPMIFDTVEVDTGIPLKLSSLSYVPDDDGYAEILNIGGIEFVHRCYLSKTETGILGIGADDSMDSVFGHISGMSLLPIHVFSMYLLKSHHQTIGEVAFGNEHVHPKNAPLRYMKMYDGKNGWILPLSGLSTGEETFETKGRGIIDMTTPFLTIPKHIFKKLCKQLEISYMKMDRFLVPDKKGCKKMKELTPIHVNLGTDKYIWDAAHFTLSLRDGFCLLAVMGVDLPSLEEGVETWIIGSSFLVDRVTVFDYDAMHIGLTDYNEEQTEQSEQAKRAEQDHSNMEKDL